MDPQVAKTIEYFKWARNPVNPNDPKAMAYAKTMLQKAANLKASPNYQKYPVELRSVIEEAHGNLLASTSKAKGTEVAANKRSQIKAALKK